SPVSYRLTTPQSRAFRPASFRLRRPVVVPAARARAHFPKPLLVPREDPLLDAPPRLAVERMRDVAEGPVLPLLARHRDEQPGLSADDLDVADHEAVVDDDGDERLELLLIEGEHPDVGDPHLRPHPAVRPWTPRQ